MNFVGKTLKVSLLSMLAFINTAGANPQTNISEFELEKVTVVGDRWYDKFGNVITEQSYYRTGGDVTVIDRREIEERHYQSLTEAIKRVPGVQISGTGHHANIVGMVGSGSTYSNELSINGDNNVVILIDGVRIGNEAMDVGGLGGGARAMLNMITAIDNVEKIEVIKGASASIYGADATGGVINIITRKGAQTPVTALNVAGGSWGNYNFSSFHSSSSDDGKTRYFFGVNRERGGDSKYKDAELGRTVTFLNTDYRDDSAIFRIDREFNDKQSLSFAYTHLNSRAGNPGMAPQRSLLHQLFDGSITPGGTNYSNPGYRNWFHLNAIYGGYVDTQTNQYTMQYIFNKDHGMPSFVRFYVERSRVWIMDFAGNGGLMSAGKDTSGNFNYLNPDYVSNFLKNRKPITNNLNNTGVDFQYAKKLGNHNVITGMEYRKNTYRWNNTNNKNYMIDSNRDFFYGWVQDKIEVSDKLTVTPGLRYSYYGDISSNYQSKERNYEGAQKMTYNLQSNYMFDDSASMYFSVSNVFRPVTYMDFDSESPLERLNNEKGMNWSLGFDKRFTDKTAAEVNFSYLNMSNAIGRYPIWDDAQGRTITRSVNSTQKKRAMNIGIKHAFDENWNIRASYAYAFDKFKSKNSHIESVPQGTTIDDMINAYRPTNIYQLDLNYSKGRWGVGLWAEILSGLSGDYFTDNRFAILGLRVNYKINQQMSMYLTVDNLTNEAYETKARGYFGKGAYPQAARSFMIGIQSKF